MNVSCETLVVGGESNWMASAGVLDHPRMWAKEPRVERSDDLLEDRIVGEDTFDAATGCVDFFAHKPCRS